MIATAQNIVPVIAPGISVSPYRIVRLVDREGHITSLRQNSETTLECTRQGYFRNPEDCSQFYRCVKFNQYENDYTIFEYACPAGLVFDDRWEVCVWPSQASPCDGSSEIRPVPRNEYVCPGEGYFVDPENCRWFFACLDHSGDGSLTHYEFRCPFGLAFDEVNLICNWPWLVPSCEGTTGGRLGKAIGALRGGNANRFSNGFSRPPVRGGKAFGGNGGRGQPILANSFTGVGDAGIGSGLPIDSRPFQSANPGRQPVRPRPNPTRRPFVSSTQTPRPTRPRPSPTRAPLPSRFPTTPAFEESFRNTFSPSSPRPRPTASPSRRPFQSTFAPSPSPRPTPSPSRRPFQSTFAPATFSARPNPTVTTASNIAGSRLPFQSTFSPSTFSPRPIATSSPSSNIFGSSSPSQRPNFGRQPTRFGQRTPTQATRRPKQFGQFGFGDIVPGSEGCRNCESNTLFITGKGVSNGKGINVAQGGRGGKSNGGFPSSTAAPVTPGYQPFFSTTPDYGSGEGLAVDNAPNGGYNYPVPTNPLNLPGYGIGVSNDGEYGIRPGSGISSTSPIPASTTTTVAPIPSTYAPTSPVPPPAYGAPSPATGYDYPAPANPLQYPTSPAPLPAYQSSYAPTTPAYVSPTPAPAYSPAPAYVSTTAAPLPPAPAPTAGYNYPVPENPLELPRGNRNQGGFNAPAIDYSGFTPSNTGDDYYEDYPDSSEVDEGQRGFTQPDIDYSGFNPPNVQDLPRRPKFQQQPSAGQGLRPGKVQFGFTPLSNQSPRRPNPNPRRPKQQFGQRPRQPFQSPGFSETTPRNSFRFPNNNNPAFFNNAVPAFTTARPRPTSPSRRPTPRPTRPPTRRPTQPPTRRPAPTTPRRPSPTTRRPQASGGRRPFTNQQVANVIPSGFSSATLSNGPNSIPQGNGGFPEGNRNVFGRPSGNGINSAFGSGRPSGFRTQPSRPATPTGLGGNRPNNAGRPSALRPPPNGVRGGNGGGNRFPNNASNRPFTAFNRPPNTGSGSRPNQRPSGFGATGGNRPTNRPPVSSNVFGSSGGNRGLANRPPPRGNANFNGNRPSVGGGSNFGNPNSGRFANQGIPNNVGGAFNGGNSIDGALPNQEGRDGRQFNGASGGRGSGSFGISSRPGGRRPVGNNRRPVGNRGFGGNNAVRGNSAGRGGRQFSRFEGKVPAHIRPANGVKVTSVTAPVKSRPAVINKFTGTDFNKFGPGGFRSFNDTMGPEVCQRPGLFRHPTECDKFYECYWDKWIEKFTLHVFPCPVVLGYDTDITACNWPFEGPHAQCAKPR